MSIADREELRSPSEAEFLDVSDPKPPKSLAPATFLIRNAGKTIPLTFVILMAVMLICGIIALVDSIPLSIRTIYSYSKVSLGVGPRGDPNLTKVLIADIKKNAPTPLDRVVVCRASSSEVQSIVGKWPFVMLGLGQDDMKYFLGREGVTRIVGRMPRAGAPEALISRPVAVNLSLGIGSNVQGPDQDHSYSPKNVKVVGIAETDRWLMVDPIEYQRAYHFPPIDLAMIFAKNQKDQRVLDAWAVKRYKGAQAEVFTYDQIEGQTQEMFKTLFLLLDFVIFMLVVIVTLMMALMINIYQNQRLVEFGLLQAIGYTKGWLVKRVLLENALIVAIGWAFGLLAAFGLLSGLKAVLMSPRAYALDVLDGHAYRYTIPVPIAILVASCATVLHRFRKFDPVAVVERRLV